MLLGKVSIIIPVYNTAKYIRECLESILDQEYKDYEVIMIDDGSTDESGAVCDEYEKRDNRFVAIHTPNNGIGAARNIGLDQATGKFCFFLDADDLIEKYTLKYLVRLIQDYEADIVLGVSKNFVDEIQGEKVETVERKYNGTNEICQEIILDKGDLKPISRKKDVPKVNYEFFSSLYRMELIRKNKLRFLTISYGEDTYLCFAYLLESTSAVTTNRPVYWHRRNPTSTTFSYHSDYLIQTKIYYQKYSELFTTKAPKYLRDVFIEGLNAQYFFRCVSAIERELFMGAKIRTISQMYNTINEIRNDNKFKKQLKNSNIKHVSQRKFRFIMYLIKYRLIFLVALYAKYVHTKHKSYK